MAEKGQAAREEEIDELEESGTRKRWMFIVWLFTWPIPNFMIHWVGRIKRKDVQLAWREKLAINMMIWLMCLISVFFLGKSAPKCYNGMEVTNVSQSFSPRLFVPSKTSLQMPNFRLSAVAKTTLAQKHMLLFVDMSMI